MAVGQLQVHATELLICIYSSSTTLFNPHLLCCRYVCLESPALTAAEPGPRCVTVQPMCSSAPCKVLNGGSRDEVITVWAVAGHHYDLITHNITTKYNYHTFIISRTDLKYALCVLSLQNCIVGFCLHSEDMHLHLRGGPGPGVQP